jgi:hypothetical protein
MCLSLIQAIATGDEDTAKGYLSSNARDAVELYCPNRSVIACFDQYRHADWGPIQAFQFISGTYNPDGSETHRYETVWVEGSDSTGFAIRTIREAMYFRVDSWQIEEGDVFPPQ